MRTVLLLFILFGVQISAQIYDQYPPDQDFYEGGEKAFYRDLHNAFIENKMVPCANVKEFIRMQFVIYPDKTVKYAKPEDSVKLAQNKCAFNLAKNSAKYLKNWKPAVVNGKNVGAIQPVVVIPNDLFSNYYDGYIAEDNMVPAEYEGGINNFRKQVMKNISPRGFTINEKVRVMVSFTVDETGKMTQIHATPTNNADFDRMILIGLRSIKKPWKPATINGIPVEYNFKLPLTFNSY